MNICTTWNLVNTRFSNSKVSLNLDKTWGTFFKKWSYALGIWFFIFLGSGSYLRDRKKIRSFPQNIYMYTHTHFSHRTIKAHPNVQPRLKTSALYVFVKLHILFLRRYNFGFQVLSLLSQKFSHSPYTHMFLSAIRKAIHMLKILFC